MIISFYIKINNFDTADVEISNYNIQNLTKEKIYINLFLSKFFSWFFIESFKF
jgi:hypothetical protein